MTHITEKTNPSDKSDSSNSLYSDSTPIIQDPLSPEHESFNPPLYSFSENFNPPPPAHNKYGGKEREGETPRHPTPHKSLLQTSLPSPPDTLDPDLKKRKRQFPQLQIPLFHTTPKTEKRSKRVNYSAKPILERALLPPQTLNKVETKIQAEKIDNLKVQV